MHNNGSSNGVTNWRKPWPQGIDNADGDAEILEMFNKSDKKKDNGPPKESYPW